MGIIDLLIRNEWFWWHTEIKIKAVLEHHLTRTRHRFPNAARLHFLRVSLAAPRVHSWRYWWLILSNRCDSPLWGKCSAQAAWSLQQVLARVQSVSEPQAKADLRRFAEPRFQRSKLADAAGGAREDGPRSRRQLQHKRASRRIDARSGAREGGGRKIESWGQTTEGKG